MINTQLKQQIEGQHVNLPSFNFYLRFNILNVLESDGNTGKHNVLLAQLDEN